MRLNSPHDESQHVHPICRYLLGTEAKDPSGLAPCHFCTAAPSASLLAILKPLAPQSHPERRARQESPTRDVSHLLASRRGLAIICPTLLGPVHLRGCQGSHSRLHGAVARGLRSTVEDVDSCPFATLQCPLHLHSRFLAVSNPFPFFLFFAPSAGHSFSVLLPCLHLHPTNTTPSHKHKQKRQQPKK